MWRAPPLMSLMRMVAPVRERFDQGTFLSDKRISRPRAKIGSNKKVSDKGRSRVIEAPGKKYYC